MKNEISKKTNIDKLFLDIKQIIDEGRRQGADAISAVICMTNWRIGRRIILEEQHGKTRAEYGKAIINSLSKKLVVEYGNNKSFSPRDLRNYRQFYLTFSDFRDLVRARTKSKLDALPFFVACTKRRCKKMVSGRSLKGTLVNTHSR